MSDLPANDEFISVNGSKFNRRLTDQFVKDIDIAHAINPNSWCIHFAGGAPFLAVGFLNAISIQGPSDGYSYLISTEGIDSHVSDLAKPYFDGKGEYAERPWAQNLRLSDEVVAQNSDLFTEAHEAAIRRMAREVDSRANRWKRHVDSFRTSLNDALAIDIPEPGYLHDIPETVFPANLAQLVDEAAFTPDHFREFLEGVDSVMLDRLAEDIELAHGVNPNSWALGQFNPRELRLYVSRQIGFQLTPSQCSFVLSGRPDHPRLKILRPDISEERAAGSEEFIFENVVQDEANLLLDEFQEQHSMAIVSLAGNVKRQLPWARNHNQDLVEELGRVAGRELPQPKYLEAMGVAPDAPRPDAAANVTDIVDPSPEAAAQMARTILAAHALSSNCWAVYSTNKRIALMVGNIVAGGSAAPGKYDFVVLRSLLDGAVVAELDVVQVPKIHKQYETLSLSAARASRRSRPGSWRCFQRRPSRLNPASLWR